MIIMPKQSPNWDELFDNYARQMVQNDLRRNPEKISQYKKEPVRTLKATIKTNLIRSRKHRIKNVEREGMVVNAGKMQSNLNDYLKGIEPEVMPRIQFKKVKTKNNRIYVYKKGRRGLLKNLPSMKAYRKWRSKQ